MVVLETSKQVVKNIYPVVLAKRHEIFKDDVTVSVLQKYLDVHYVTSVYVATTIIYLLEAEGYVSKPLIEHDGKRKLLR
ncbi:hypothetical protein FZC66_08470 [Priestia megaterium]|nr:hypothetical protein FZC66_08470 [Priestia megaterium]